MTIHRNGHAGHEGHIVPSVHDLKVGGVRGQHLFSLIHRVGEGFIVDVEIEHVAGLQLGKIGKEPHIAHARMTRQYAMGTFTAHWHVGCRQGRVNVRGFDKMNFLL